MTGLYIQFSAIRRHPREGGGLARRRKTAFINVLRTDRIPAFAGMANRGDMRHED